MTPRSTDGFQRAPLRTLLMLLSLVAILPCTAIAAPFQTKTEVLDMGVLDTGRPSKISLWYPASACPANTARLCLADGAVTSKVVLFSHGSMGSAAEYSWLGESLASAGFVVVGVNHFGESRAYGEKTQNPRTTALTWQRAQDVSALLTRLSKQKLFQRDVDWNNVVAIGHSAGGQTAALLAGAKYDLRRIAPYCKSAAAKADRSCNYARNSANAPDPFVRAFSASYQDTRIKKLVLLDPAQGFALQPDSLKAIALPSLIVGARHDDFLPWENHGQRYAAGIPNAQSVVLEGQEGHFVFLNPCQHKVEVMGVSLCRDRPGVDRAAVQRDLAPRIVAFVSQDNEPSVVTTHPGAGASVGEEVSIGDLPSNMLFEILIHTPPWVFALLVGLAAFGLMQVRTRPVPTWLALLLPAGMMALSLSSVLLYVGLWAPALAAWAVGLGAVAALYGRAINPETARYDEQSRKLVIAGSWLPLLVILAIFVVRYAMGVADGMGLEIFRDRYVQSAVSLLLGGFSGFFLARGITFWRAFAARPQPVASV